MNEIQKYTTQDERKKSWAIRVGDQKEFHGPGDFYWHGQACCLWSARYYGWSAYMGSKGYGKEEI